MEIVLIILAITVVVLAGLLVFGWRPPGSGQPMTEALSQVSNQLLTLAEERFARHSEAGTRELDTKKQLIDQRLEAMNRQLERVSTLVQSIEKDREAKFSELTTYIKSISQQTVTLTASTASLREALSSSSGRGQWGQRMAEDVLRLIGFVEGVNYQKQTTIESAGSRPDFIFLLPGNLRMNMDVKFPFDNYLRYLETDSSAERDRHRSAFLRDVRARMREVTTREYIDPAGGTVDYVLLFIPNESVYSFIHEQDPAFIDTALQSKVILCSPITLFAVLAVVRQAVDNFALQKASEEIISLFGRFDYEWNKFSDALDTVGKRLGSTLNAFEQVVGPRKRQLERPLRQIETLRQQREIPVAPAQDDSPTIDIGSDEYELVDGSREQSND